MGIILAKKLNVKINKAHIKALLIISACLSFTACETLFGTYTGRGAPKEEKRELITLGDISDRPVQFRRVKIRNVSAEDTMSSYQEVLDNTEDPELKFEATRRIADLSLIAIEDRVAQQADIADNIDKVLQKIPEGEEPSEEHLQEIAELEAEIVALGEMNDLAYQKAIESYENILKDQPENKDNDIVLYQLAAAYDLSGQQDKTLDTLDRLTTKHKESQYYTEAEFRRAEIYFVKGDYLTATEAYQSVQASKVDKRFEDHSLYKHGWSLFKVNEYPLAIEDFITLRDRLGKKVERAKKLRRRYNSASDENLIKDTNRVIALSFSHLEGPEDLKNYFAKIGGREYEYDIYQALYGNYIHQERYRDAANTYDIFLDTYPTHKDAPKLQSAILQAYQDGGFPSLVLPGKIDYVKRFGIHSEFWKLYVAEDATQKVYTPEEREELLDVVKTHLEDVSKHYHSIAQNSQKKTDYEVAATWYREYIDTFASSSGTDEDKTLEIRKLLAESLYESEQYSLAVIEFEKLARASGNNPEAGAEASYFALLSYQEMLNDYKGDEKGKEELIAKKVASSYFFIDNYRTDKRMPNVLGNIIRDQITIKDYEGAVKNSRVLVSLDPPASQSMQKTAWVTIANAEFDGKNYASAEEAYQKVLTYPGWSKKQRVNYYRQIASSIFKNAEDLKEKGELVPAAEEFLRLGKVVPASRIRPKAHFDAANAYLEAKEWNKAIQTLNVFKRLYPKHKLIETFPDKMAIAYKNTDQHAKASAEYVKIAQRYEKSNAELARQSYWEAATLVEKAEDKSQSMKLFKHYANTYKDPLEQNVEAQYRLVKLYEEKNNQIRVAFWKDKILKTHRKAGENTTPRVTYLAAQIEFENVEPDFTRYRRIKLKQPLKNSLKKKKNSMDVVLKKYQEVAKMGSAEYTTASNHRIGRVYQVLASDLMSSQRPKGFTADQLEQYDILLEDQAIPFEDQAIEVFEHNADLVLENVYDKWVKASIKELSRLIPGRWAKFEKQDEYVESIY